MSKNTKLDEILNSYKVGELKELAKISGITGYSKLKKAELIEAISEQLEVADTASLDLREEVSAALTVPTEEAVTVKNAKEEKKVTRSSAPIIGVAPHVMNVMQDGQVPFTQINRPAAVTKKVYPNDPCPCGSGKKYKKCCARA